MCSGTGSIIECHAHSTALQLPCFSVVYNSRMQYRIGLRQSARQHASKLAASARSSHRNAMLARPVGTRHAVCMAGKIQKLNAEELEVALQTRDRPLIIDFMATWCGPCLLMAQELEKVADELGDTVRIVKVDTDEEPDLSSQLQIQGLPTVVYVAASGDKPALRTEGLLPAATIKEIIFEELMGGGNGGRAAEAQATEAQ